MRHLARLPTSYRWTIDDYQFARSRRLDDALKIRDLIRRFGESHYRVRLKALQQGLLELRDRCLEARQVAIMQQDLRDEPSPSDLDMLADEAAALGKAA